MNKNKQDEFELQFKTLIGKKISQVIYYEIQYENNKHYWNNNPEFDSLDFGLDLILNTGECFGIIWDQEFYQYGFSLTKNSLQMKLNSCNRFDVSKTSRWIDYLNTEIQSYKINWSWVKESGFFKKKIYYPQDLIFTLNNKNIYLSNLIISENDECFGMADNIIVIFDEKIAKKYKIELL